MLNALTIAAALAATAAGADSPNILFSSTRDGNTDLYLMKADGTGERRLTTDAAADEIGRCSPDGRFVVFRRGGGQSGDLYRLDLQSGEELRLTNDPSRDSAAAWSADGATIYFTKRHENFDRIARMRADGSDPGFVTQGAWHDVVPSVSPDGRQLVFHTYRYGKGSDLEVMDLASGTSRRVTALDDGSYDYEPFFADADTILYSSNREGGHYRLYAMSLATGQSRKLADTGADIWGGRYSARTGDVLFYTGTPAAWRMLRVPLAGGAPTAIAVGGQSNYFPDWCPQAQPTAR
jgi:Tol biopolymer transport system component